MLSGGKDHSSYGGLWKAQQPFIHEKYTDESQQLIEIPLETDHNLLVPDKDILNKIDTACNNLAKAMDESKDVDELAVALRMWESELDLMSLLLPSDQESYRKIYAKHIEKSLSEIKGERFHAVIDGQLHTVRRAQGLIKYGDKIRNLYGYDPTTAFLALAIVIAQTLYAALANNASWGGFFLLLLIGSVLNHMAGMVIHEASHNLAAPTPMLNRLTGMIANLALGVPHQGSFERQHWKHHAFLGQPEIDNDLPSPALARWVGNSSWRKALWLALFPLAYGVTQKPECPNSKQIVNFLVQAGWDAGIVYTLGPWALAYLIGSSLVGFSALHPVSAHWIDEHFVRNKGRQETYSYYGFFNFLNKNVGYHNEHHDFPRIPGCMLPVLHELMKEEYEELEGSTSWAFIIWNFITNPEISAHNRIIRTDAANNDARKEAARHFSRNISTADQPEDLDQLTIEDSTQVLPTLR